MEKKRIIGIIIIVLILTVGCTWYLQSLQVQHTKPMEDITIDPSPTTASTLLLVASDQGYFAQHGLHVTFKRTPSGSILMQDILDHKIDFGYVNEYSLSEPALYNKPIRVIGTLSESDTIYLVGRKDKGIMQIKDLEGKRIGVSKNSIGEYFLDRFLTLHGLSSGNITITYLQPASLVDALKRGDIDVAVSFEPYVYQMRQDMGENVTVWPANLGQHAHFSLVGNEVSLQEHPGIVEAVLASVLQAETYVNSHPEEAKKVAQKITNFTDDYRDQEWENHHFAVTLSQSLITSMEDEARWRVRKNLTNATDVPDFSDYIYRDTLVRLKPDAVTLLY